MLFCQRSIHCTVACSYVSFDSGALGTCTSSTTPQQYRTYAGISLLATHLFSWFNYFRANAHITHGTNALYIASLYFFGFPAGADDRARKLSFFALRLWSCIWKYVLRFDSLDSKRVVENQALCIACATVFYHVEFNTLVYMQGLRAVYVSRMVSCWKIIRYASQPHTCGHSESRLDVPTSLWVDVVDLEAKHCLPRFLHVQI